jgi:oligopeptide/dipeptide ABC transporter ATP-binding protein
MAKDLLEVKNLRTYFYTRRGVVKAVEGVTFSLNKGETFGLVGESGCGKSVTCLSILRLVPEPAGRIVGGQILLEGEDLLKMDDREIRKVRGKKISMILQDPMTSLNPVFSIGNQVTEALRIHHRLRGRDLLNRAKQMLRLVRIPSPEMRLRNYPHELSGGMRQRVVGAISLSCEPQIIIADEPTTSLDATLQVQYLDLLKEVQNKLGLAILFVTHDFGIVARMCDRVAVMYAGRIVEMAEVRELFNHPLHPYTVGLMKSLPKVEERVEMLDRIKGEPPSLLNLPPGCVFAPRCSSRNEECNADGFPPSSEVSTGHRVRCWLYA